MQYDTMALAMDSYRSLMEKAGQRHLAIRIYGGEPLLNKSIYKLIENYSNRGFEIDWVLNTNGSLMTEQAAEIFKAHNVDVHITDL
jgi:sulfatase maturation enzyme AslB (radical SAM superfamily)